MKVISLTLLLTLFATISRAQPWLEDLPQDKSRRELTFYDYQNAFENYWLPYNVVDGYYIENGEKKKAPGWKQFKRWEYMMELRADMVTGAFPDKSAFEIVNEHFRSHPQLRSSPVSDWISLGPSTSPGGFQGIGRMNCVAFHPTDTATIWAGAATGGLWVTNNNGVNWTCLTDKTGVLAVTDIVIPDDYDISRTIYIATGDRDGYDNNSIGVLKSTDGGINWFETDLHYTLAERKFINRLIIDHSDSQLLIAATSEGVYQTTDGGITWDHQLTDMVFIDMEFHPTNSEIIYGSTFDGEIYVSTNGGGSWTRTLWEFDAARVEIAVTPAEPSWVYAVGARESLEGIYKSIDNGMSFVRVMHGDTLNLLNWDMNGVGTGGQGSYDLCIAASPFDANTIFVGGVSTWRSTDGGTSWSISSHWAGGDVVVHADKHSLRFRSNGELWECNDGGLYVSYDHGTSWNDKTNGIAISQMYRLGVSATEKDDIVTGLQDNGSKLHTPFGWLQVNGGDGTECMIDPVDNNIQYSTSQNGNLFRTLDHWNSARYIKPQDAGGGAWVTPFVIDPQDPKIIYGGFREIWKTTDRGDTWTQVSAINAIDKIRMMAIAPSDPQIVYAAQSFQLYKSTTGGEPFVKAIGNIPNQTNAMSYIAVKHDDPQTLWISVAGFSYPGVFQSIDGGTTWTNISSGLPQIPVYTIVQNKQASNEVELFAGTELGVYFKKGNEDWVPFSNGLPNVIISELEIYYTGDPTQARLRAATYGRGLWETRIEFVSSPMTFVSGTSLQKVTSTVKPGQNDQEIMKIEVVTTGDLEPLHAYSLTVNTNGSTDPLTDISEARLYYTGSINAFLTNNTFGEAIISPNGTFTFEDEVELISGINYFWLVYDVPATAVEGNVLDAQCVKINIGTDESPLITDPPGNRIIKLTYCDAGSTHLSSEYISRVMMGNIDQLSSKGEDGYQDFTDQIVDMEIGKSLEISVKNYSPFNSNELLIWIDWNKDGDLDDGDELMYESGPLGVTTYTTSITPPATAKIGLTRMRIRLHDKSFGPNTTPCGVANLGEVEDYSVNVSEEVMVSTSNESLTKQMFVYPNPASENFVIEIPGNQRAIEFEIINVLGKVAYRDEIVEHVEISTGEFLPGIYFIRAGGSRFSVICKR